MDESYEIYANEFKMGFGMDILTAKQRRRRSHANIN